MSCCYQPISMKLSRCVSAIVQNLIQVSVDGLSSGNKLLLHLELSISSHHHIYTQPNTTIIPSIPPSDYTPLVLFGALVIGLVVSSAFQLLGLDHNSTTYVQMSIIFAAACSPEDEAEDSQIILLVPPSGQN